MLDIVITGNKKALGGVKTMENTIAKSQLIAAPSSNILLCVDDKDYFCLVVGDTPPEGTYQRCFEGGHSAYLLKDTQGALIPSNLYKLDDDIFYPILDIDGDAVSGGGVFVQLLHNDRYPSFATFYGRNQHLSIGCEIPIDEWIELNAIAK